MSRRSPLTATAGPTVHQAPDVSVLVTVHNEQARLPLLLSALAGQTLAADRYELVVVDDASEDDTREVARRHPGARVVALPTHSGLAAGRNAGIRAATGRLIAFTDGDCLPHETWLERGVERLSETGADVLVGGIEMPLGPGSSLAALVDATIYLNQASYAQAGFGAGANLWFRRDVFARFGLFNERVGLYGDETELCQRAVRNGARLVYAPDVRLVHPPRRRARDVLRKSLHLGATLAAHRRFGSGPLQAQRPLFAQWRRYLPRRRVDGLERLRGEELADARARLAALYLGQYALVRLPHLIGDLAGELRYGLGGGERPERSDEPLPVLAAADRGEPVGLEHQLAA